MKLLKDNEELVRHAGKCWSWTGCRNGWGELRKEEGDEECRGEEKMKK